MIVGGAGLGTGLLKLPSADMSVLGGPRFKRKPRPDACRTGLGGRVIFKMTLRKRQVERTTGLVGDNPDLTVFNR
jgi:hypothetical protein